MRIKKRYPLVELAIILLLFFLTSCMLARRPESQRDYSRLVEFIKANDNSAPLYAFNDFEEAFDEDCHRESVEFLNDHPKLIRRIQKDLNHKAPKWKLDKLAYRLVFVPEVREAYATLL